MRRSSYLGIALALLSASLDSASSAKSKNASLQEILLDLNAKLGYAQSKARSDAKEIIELYPKNGTLANGTSARAELLYGKAKADYDAILAELDGDLAERVKKPKPIDLTTAERDLNAFSTYAETQIDIWIRKNPDSQISQADTTKARLSWNDSMTGTNAGAGTPAAGGASAVSSISPIGTIVLSAITSLVNEIDKLNEQTRKDEVALLETTRWLDWSAIADPKAPASQSANVKSAAEQPAKDAPKPKQ